MFNKYFYSTFTKTSTEVSEFITNSSPDDHNLLSEVFIDEDNVFIALCNLNPTKATGCDEIGPKILIIFGIALYTSPFTTYSPRAYSIVKSPLTG